jgi:hypothetical protein
MTEKLPEVKVSFGELRYRSEVKEIPGTTETGGDLTWKTKGRPGLPEHFEATFTLSCKIKNGPLRFDNNFLWTTIVVGHGKDAPYSTVESEAVRQLAPELRAAAQRIEDMLRERASSRQSS